MLQAFVSLKPQQPARTESGMRSFFEAIQNAVFSQPTVFRTNADASVRPYSLDAVVEAALNPRCKFVVLRADCEKFWQCTFLLPDVQGIGALYFDLQRANSPRRIKAESLMNMFKKLYESISPKIVRVGDSEAREKLKSRHGLVMMPGIGRVEWLQIVSPEIYGDIYNPSDLVAAPCFQSEIWEDGALFLRVYEDPNEWDSEDNESLANFIPGFLAGIAKIKDGEKEKETLRELETLWSRAEKTAKKAYAALDGEAGKPVAAAAAVSTQAATPAKPVAVAAVKAAPAAAASDVDAATAKMRSVILSRLVDEQSFKGIVESDITKIAVEGPCTVFSVQRKKKGAVCVSYQDSASKVYILNVLEDLAKFLKENGCKVQDDGVDHIKELVRKYYCCENQLLNTLDDLPANVINDRRVPDFRKEFNAGITKSDDGTRELVLWIYQPDGEILETLSLTQYESWPVQVESKIVATDMENAPAAPQAAAPVEAKKEDVKIEPVAKPVVEKKDAVPVKAETANVPAKKGGAGKVVVSIILALVIIYVILVMAVFGGDWTFPMSLLNK